MRVSKFIKVNKNILLEYIYNDDNNIGNAYKILLNSKDNIANYSYIAGTGSVTNNILENQLFKIDSISNNYGLINTNNYSFLQLKDYSEGFPARHDTIKIHLPVNYTFGEYIGCYIKVFTFDYNNKKTYELTNFFFDVSDTNQGYLMNLSNPALIFQEKLWGKYVEVSIPSIRYLSGLRTGLSAKENTINYNLTNGVGLSTTSPIFIDFHFINSRKTVNKVTTYYLTSKTTLNLPQAPDFEKIGLKIEHSKSGDFFEIFGTYNGTISEFNTFMKNSLSIGKRYYVEFTVTMFEQNIRGKSVKFTVQENFNEKVEFRPIIKYSTTTAIIDVQMDLIDLVDNSSIQRRASYGMLQDEVAKYSLNLTKINLAKASKPKIYNIKSPEGAGIFGNLNGSAYSDGRLYGSAGGSLFSNNTTKNLAGTGANAGLSLFAASKQRNLFSRAGGRGGFGGAAGVGGGDSILGGNGGQVVIGGIPVDNQSGIAQIADSTKTQVVLQPYPVNYTVLADRYNVLAKSENVRVGKKNFYGIGRLKLMIQPFDQLIQFIIAQDVSEDQIIRNNGNGSSLEYALAPKYMDLSGMGEIKLVFKNTKKTVDFKIYTQTQQNDLTKGQIVFRISENKINEIREIANSGINVFYITSSINTVNSVVYSGLFTLFDNQDNVNQMNTDQKEQEAETGDKQEPSIISVVEEPERGTAIVTRRLIRDPEGDITAGGAGTETGDGGTGAGTGGNQNTDTQPVLTNSSVPSAIKIAGITYEIDSSSNIKIDGYTWTSGDLKKALGLTELPLGLSIKDDALYTKEQILDKLSVIKTKLESLLTTKEEKDKYSQTQKQTRKEIGSDQEFSYYNLEFGLSGVATTNTQQVLPTDYKIIDTLTGQLITSIPKQQGEETVVGTLIRILGKKYMVKENDATLREIKVSIDQ
jgi:hypothetical protein